MASSVHVETSIEHECDSTPCQRSEPSKSSKKRSRTESRSSRLEGKTVVIVGGGIAGLATALGVQRKGGSAVVLERDVSLSSRKQGYGLTLTYSEKGPLKELGLLNELAHRDESAAASRRHWLFRSSGDIIGYFGNDFASSERKATLSQRGNLRIPRQDLRELLYTRLKEGTVRWAAQVASIRCPVDGSTLSLSPSMPTLTEAKSGPHGAVESGTKPLVVTLSTGEELEADVVVGADGIRSRVRDQLVKDQLRTLGVFIILGISPHRHPLIHEGGFYSLDGTHRLFTMPYSSTLTMWQLSFRFEDDSEAQRLSMLTGTELKAEVLNRCKAWHEPVCDLVSATPDEEVWGTELFDRLPVPTFCKPNASKRSKKAASDESAVRASVTLVGDAAHPMSPFKGQGANQALCDCVRLVNWLSKAPVESALPCYEREMIATTSQKVTDSRQASTELHSETVTAFGAHRFAGVSDTFTVPFLEDLQQHGVNAKLAEGLWKQTSERLRELEMKSPECRETSQAVWKEELVELRSSNSPSPAG